MYLFHKSVPVVILLLVLVCPLRLMAQSSSPGTLTSKELVSLIYQLPKYPEKRDEIVEEIRRRGIGFPLTDGMRSLVATKSGNDALLRRTLEEAERRRVNPTASALPPEAEGNDLLDRARAATLAAADAMPDFVVKQQIKRSYAFGNTANWIPQDNLTIAVSYRANSGEQYRVLAVNGLPTGQETTETKDYSKYVSPGATSSGVEYISALADVFKQESHADIKLVDTDVLQGRRALVYEYLVRLPFSTLTLTQGHEATANVGSRGRLWIDRESYRVLRFEQIATEIPAGFPITAASSRIDFDWVSINEKQYLLPSYADVLLTSVYKDGHMQSRNEIRFRGYRKFGAELKLIEEIDDPDLPADKPDKSDRPTKPTKP